MMEGSITLSPLEFLALAATPLAAFSKVLKDYLTRFYRSKTPNEQG